VKRKNARIAHMVLLLGWIFTSCQSQPAYWRANPALKATSTPFSHPDQDPPANTPTPKPSATVRPACLDTKGQLHESKYTGSVYAREISYIVYLPPCYADSALSYPVVYLLHGLPYDEYHWLDLGLVEAYELGTANYAWPQVIFVLPSIPEPLFTRSDGGVGSYEQEFLEGLVPAIEVQYRVASDAEKRVLGGVSRGGVWALEIGLRNTDVIQHTVAISPALVNNQPRPRYDPFQIVLEDRPFPETLFLSAAENETPFREEIEDFVQVLEQQGIDHTFLLHPGNHNDATWRAIIEQILEHLLAGLTT